MTDDETPDQTQDQTQEQAEDETQPDEPVVEEPKPKPEPAPKPDRADRPGFFVPRWLAIFLGLVIVILLAAGGGFWVGRETADDDHCDGRCGSRDVPREQPERPREVPGPFPVPEAPSEDAAFLGVGVDDNASPAGALVVQVAPGSPAEDAGVQEGDVIVALDGESIDGAESLGETIAALEPGDDITITVDRDGVETTLQATLGAPDAQSA